MQFYGVSTVWALLSVGVRASRSDTRRPHQGEQTGPHRPVPASAKQPALLRGVDRVDFEKKSREFRNAITKGLGR